MQFSEEEMSSGRKCTLTPFLFSSGESKAVSHRFTIQLRWSREFCAGEFKMEGKRRLYGENGGIPPTRQSHTYPRFLLPFCKSTIEELLFSTNSR